MKNRASEFIGDTIIALAQILALCALLTGLAAVIAVLFWQEAYAEWVETHLYWPLLYTTVVAIAATLFCLLLSTIRSVRPIARVVIYLSTSVIFYSLWVWMLLVTAALAGT
jgi:hypothetical protein